MSEQQPDDLMTEVEEILGRELARWDSGNLLSARMAARHASPFARAYCEEWDARYRRFAASDPAAEPATRTGR